jgi:hypothetical protein
VCVESINHYFFHCEYRKTNIYSTGQLYASHPRGHYLADGAYKEVFKVFSSEQKRLEAISVMDINALEDNGNQVRTDSFLAHSHELAVYLFSCAGCYSSRSGTLGSAF